MDIAQLYDIDAAARARRRRRLHGRPAAVKVFVLAEHPDPKQRHYLNLYKMGEGPLYPFWIPYHLVHFETPFSIARVVLFGDELAPPLGGPVVEVCAVAKRDLKAGEVLDEYGMYMTYGEAVNVEEMSARRYLPEGLVEGCQLMRDIAKDAGAHLRRRGAARGPPRRPAAGRAVPALPGRDLARGSLAARASPRRTAPGPHAGQTGCLPACASRPGGRAMKVVIFCGGLGMRLREYSEAIPKPMVPIGYRPILWHVMRYYAHFGHKDFILCLGYKGDVIKNYFLDYDETVSNDFVLREGGKKIELLASDIHDWNITFVDTGLNVQHRQAPQGGAAVSWRARRCSSPTTATGSPTFRCPDMIDSSGSRRGGRLLRRAWRPPAASTWSTSTTAGWSRASSTSRRSGCGSTAASSSSARRSSTG